MFITVLLYVLVRKEQKWKQEKKQEKAFEKLKAMFTIEPVLAILDINRKMKVEANTSDYATGGCCQQSVRIRNRDQWPLSLSC